MVTRSAIPLEPSTPDWMKRFALRNEQAWVPRVPESPIRLPIFVTADLPAASAYPFCIAFDTTLGVPVCSNGTNWVALA